LGQGNRFSTARARFAAVFAVAAGLLAAGGVLLAARRAIEDRRFLLTGPARWIWWSREIPEPAPLRFRCWKEFHIEGERPAHAPTLFFGDCQWMLEVNGHPLASGSQKPGAALRGLDAAAWLESGVNRIRVEASSANGVGAILFWMDLGSGRLVVSDRTWEAASLPAGNAAPRRVEEWGRPPMYPWGYPRPPER